MNAIDMLTESQAAVLDVFRNVLRREATFARARAAEPLGFDPDLWHHMREVDAPALGLTAGGAVGLAELVVMAETIGRSIAAAPIIEHVVAARTIERLVGTVDDDVVNGASIATVALRASVDDTWRLVPAGAVASIVIGVHGDDVVMLRAPAPRTAPLNHASAPIAHRAVAPAVTPLGDRAEFDRTITEWQLLTAAALVGIADAALALAVEYAAERRQFGVPIGSFQAIQHSLADLPGSIDGARLLVHEAAWALDGGRTSTTNGIDLADDLIDDGPTLAAMAFLFAADVASTATHRSLHVHGGYGFSEEYDIQLLYRRARGWALIGGDPGHLYARLADRLLADDHHAERVPS